MTKRTRTQAETDVVIGTVAIILVAAALVYGIFFAGNGGKGDDTPERVQANPCSAEVLEAPFKTGEEYVNVDQRAERDEACLRHRLEAAER